MSKELQINTQRESLLKSIAEQWGCPEIEPRKLYETLKATAFKGKKNGDSYTQVTDEQFMALSIVSKQYKLNPFLKEIYAYPDKQGGIVPVVGVDGWSNIINSHPQMDGLEYRYSEEIVTVGKSKKCPEWIECIITRKDRTKPIIVREYLDECYQEPGFATPWQTHTKRFLRHKATIQCGRMAFGFGGIYDQDEAENIIKDVTPALISNSVKDLNEEFLNINSSTTSKKGEIIDSEVEKNIQSDDLFEEKTLFSLTDRVHTICADIAMDRECVGTDDFKDITNSEAFKTLWTEVKSSGDKSLLGEITSAMSAT